MQILCLFFLLFLFKGSSKCGFFHLAVLFRFYRVLFLHHVFLSEQIKMMMNWCKFVKSNAIKSIGPTHQTAEDVVGDVDTREFTLYNVFLSATAELLVY